MKIPMTFLAMPLLITFSGVIKAGDENELKDRIVELQAQLKAYEAERKQVEANLELFREMDLEAFNSHDFERITEIHDDDVLVYMNDEPVVEGHQPVHEEQLRFLFDALDMRVAKHVVRFGQGDWTAGFSISEGMWINPITLEDGTVLAPTGKPYSIRLATLARWENGRIAEEHLFYDNDSLYRQIGLIK